MTDGQESFKRFLRKPIHVVISFFINLFCFCLRLNVRVYENRFDDQITIYDELLVFLDFFLFSSQELNNSACGIKLT